jgi:hypothetical protein
MKPLEQSGGFFHFRSSVELLAWAGVDFEYQVIQLNRLSWRDFV